MANPETKVSAFVYDKNKKCNATLAEVTNVTTLADMKKSHSGWKRDPV